MVDPFVPLAQNDKDREFLGEFIKSQRAESAAEKAAREASGISANDIKVTGNGLEPSGSLSDSEFESFRDTFSSEPGFSSADSRRFRVDDADDLNAADPLDITSQRSASELRQDRNRQARVTTNVSKYASDPNSYDFPFIDTPPEFNEQYSNDNSLIPGNVDKHAVRKGRDSGFEF